MVKKRALGKGLAALIHEMDSDSKTQELSEIREVEISKIESNPYQPRKTFSEEEIKELAESIKNSTLLNPISLNQKDDDDQFVLISGERRLKAFKYLNRTTIPARIFSVDEEQLSLLALIENMQRVDLNDIEKAEACKNIKKKFLFSDEEVSVKIGVSRSQVTNLMRLLTLSDEVLSALRSTKVTVGQVRPLIGLSQNEQKEILDKILECELSSRDVEEIVRKAKNRASREDSSVLKKERMLDIEGAISHKIGETKVRVFKKHGKYQVTLEIKQESDIKKIFNIQ